jgi:anthranilate phosphoribosyltransferase
LRGGDAAQNAAELRAVLEGGTHSNAKRDAVVLNAGVGVYVYGLVASIGEGVALARRVLESGKAIETLDLWVETSKSLAKQNNGYSFFSRF